MISRLEFFISETIMSIRRHPAMAFAAAICVAAALFVAGMVGLVVINASSAVDNAINRVRFSVYCKTTLKDDEVQKLLQYIRSMSKVESAVLVTKAEAWDKEMKEHPDWKVSLGDDNPYPDRIDVKPKLLTQMPALEKEMKGWPQVSSVGNDSELENVLVKARDFVSRIGLIIGFILVILSLVIIHHTIELTLYARRKEINIMSLVGATPTTVAMPFLLEGMIYGLLGALIALGMLSPMYGFLVKTVKLNLNANLLSNSAFLVQGATVIIIAGVCLGLIGSLLSIGKFLRNPRSRITNS